MNTSQKRKSSEAALRARKKYYQKNRAQILANMKKDHGPGWPKRKYPEVHRRSSKKYYQKNRERILAKLREKYQEDESYRNKIKQSNRQRYHNDPEYRKATIEQAKKSRARRKDLKPEDRSID
jgi:hypothetical protein